MMGTISSHTCSILLLSTILLGLCLQSHVATHDHNNVVLLNNKRETLEILFSGGGTNNNAPSSSHEYGQHFPPPPPPPKPSCPPPPPKPSPPPPPPKPSCPPPPPKPSPPPPPPKPSCPPPPPPPSSRLELVKPVIKKFHARVTKDPLGVLNTWKGQDICNYKGIVCDNVPAYNETGLAGINFNGFKFGGPNLTLDGFIEELPDIVLFHANSNNFSGKIPAKITKLKFFYELDLSNNKFSGEFPTTIFGNTQLTFLDLRFNSFCGKVPPQLYNLNILYLIFINNNNFAQPLPDNIGSTPALYLTFANNKFTGPIPRSIGNASKTLTEVLFLNNQLSGCLPFEIGYLKKAILFDASFNLLTGSIPCSFACLEKMQLLNFTNNLLYGSIPELVCKLPQLGNLSLANNYINEIGPECKKLINNGVLDVKNNCICGLPNQRSKVECNEFYSKPRRCPDERSLSYVPCKKKLLSMSSRSLKPKVQTTVASPRLYGALTPDKS